MRCEDCCRTELTEVHAEQNLRVGPFLFTAQLRARQCPTCKSSFFDGIELERFDCAVARALALSGEIGGDAFGFMREAVGILQKELALALRVSPATITDWESGKAPVPAAAMTRLAKIVIDRTERPDVPRVQMRCPSRPTSSTSRSRCA